MCSLDKCPLFPSVSVGVPGKLRHTYLVWDARGAFVFLPSCRCGISVPSWKEALQRGEADEEESRFPFFEQTDLVHLFFFTLGGWDSEIGFYFIYQSIRLCPAFLPSLTSVNFFGCCSCSSVTQLCLTLCDHMDCSTPGFPVHHQLPELTQTHVHRVSDANQLSHPLSYPSPPILMYIIKAQLDRWFHRWFFKIFKWKHESIEGWFYVNSAAAAAAAKSLQSCPTVSSRMDCSLPGSSAHGIFQATVLEWVAIAFSETVLHLL